MKNQNILIFLLLALLSWLPVGCDLDITNPNQATEAEVATSPDGIRNVTVGIQGLYSTSGLSAIILTPAVTTREMAINTTFASLIELESGGTALPPENSRTNRIWNNLFRVIEMSDLVIEDAPELITREGELSGILATAQIHKAMSLGYLVQSFEQSPITTGEDVTFQTRDDVLNEAIGLLEDALQRISDTPPSDDFRSNILIHSDFDFENTIHAYQARYNLLLGNYEEAIAQANAVDPQATSFFTYDGTSSENPVFQGVLSADEGQEYAARDNFGTPVTETGDNRLDFYLNSSDEVSTPNELQIDQLSGFFTSASDPIPVYIPGEMNLIRAEAHIRLNELNLAVDEINSIRTKTAADDPLGIGADLPAYSGPVTEDALVTEVYRQRTAELYLTGMRFDDMRRLDRPVPSAEPSLNAERNRVYYPYPRNERQNNPNTPPNPDI